MHSRQCVKYKLLYFEREIDDKHIYLNELNKKINEESMIIFLSIVI